MQFTIDRDALLAALAYVHGAVARKSTIPILSTVKLSVDDQGCRLTATDLDMQVTARALHSDVGLVGQCAAPAETLLGFVKKLPKAAAVKIAMTDDEFGARLQLVCGRARLAIPALPAVDFPCFDRPAAECCFDIPAGDMRRLLEKTRFAVSTEETRYYLNGVFLHFRDEELRATATDGHRLAMASMNLPVKAEDGMSLAAIVPTAAVNELRKLVADYDGPVQISCDGARLQARAGDVELGAKLIDGQFPDYARIVPKPQEAPIVVNRQALIEALGRVLIVSDADARSVRLQVQGESMTVRARHVDHGEASEELAIAAAGDLEVGFNGRYLLDQLGALEGEEISLHVADANSPARIEDGADARVVGVLMPLRV